MKKLFVLAFAIVFMTAFNVHADSIDSGLRNAITDMTTTWIDANPGSVLRPTIAVLPFRDESTEAASHSVGAALREYAIRLLSLSTTFVLVDRDNLDAQLREIELSLSGATEGTRLTVGELLDIDYLLAGTVTELGGNYTLTLKLISVETSEIAYGGAVEMPGAEVVKEAEAFKSGAYQYGLGIELGACLFMYFTNPMADYEGQSTGESFGNIVVLYRPFSWLVVGVGMEIASVPIRLSPDGLAAGRGSPTWVTVPNSDVANMSTDGSGTWIFPWGSGDIMYANERNYYAIMGTIGYVIQPLNELNITIGLNLYFSMHSITTYYQGVPYLDPTSASFDGDINFRILAQGTETFDLEPYVKVQWFFAPRISLNLIYQYRWQTNMLSSAESGEFYRFFYGDRYDDIFVDLWDLDPSLDPWGNPLLFDLTGHRVTVTFGIYF